MKIVVIGGTGLIGSKLVNLLRARGHEVIAASPNTGVNTLTGEGLAEALAGAEVVVDVANSPSFEDKAVMDFFVTSGRNLLAAEKAAGVKHHVALSVVGTQRVVESGYLRAKAAQENLIKASSIPYTILESTQFFEFIERIAKVGARRRRLSPVAGADAADRLGRGRRSACRHRARARRSTARSKSAGPKPSRSMSWRAKSSSRAKIPVRSSRIRTPAISARS